MKSILIIDDERELVSILEEEFRLTGGYRIVTAFDGIEGYRKARNQKFDLILTDFSMPKLNGASLIQSLREQEANRHTPVIVFSAYPEQAKAESMIAQAGGQAAAPPLLPRARWTSPS